LDHHRNAQNEGSHDKLISSLFSGVQLGLSVELVGQADGSVHLPGRNDKSEHQQQAEVCYADNLRRGPVNITVINSQVASEETRIQRGAGSLGGGNDADNKTDAEEEEGNNKSENTESHSELLLIHSVLPQDVIENSITGQNVEIKEER